MVGRTLKIEIDPPNMHRRENVTGPQQYGGCGRAGTGIQISRLPVQCSSYTSHAASNRHKISTPPIILRPRAKACIGHLKDLVSVWGFKS